jgi:hypothetical protein
VPSIYQEEITKLRDDEWDADSKEIVQKLPTFYSSKSTLYRARRKQAPKLPASSIDIQLDGKWTETSTGERFLLFDDTQQQQRIIAYAATENLTDLSASDRIYCDGTFYTCPSVFHQIYTIHMQEWTGLHMILQSCPENYDNLFHPPQYLWTSREQHSTQSAQYVMELSSKAAFSIMHSVYGAKYRWQVYKFHIGITRTSENWSDVQLHCHLFLNTK